MKILLVEDEITLAETLKLSLEKINYVVDIVMDGEEAEKRILVNHKNYDLIILDWMLPKKEGVQICKNIRQAKINTPILMLTAKFDVKDKVTALDSGADDYLVKPFSLEELEARVRALLRRPPQTLNETIEIGALRIFPQKHQVYINKKIIRLTTKEFALLEYLARNTDVVVSRDQLLNHLWGFDFDSFSNVLDSHIKNLRSKIKIKGKSIIETVRGCGYTIKSY